VCKISRRIIRCVSLSLIVGKVILPGSLANSRRVSLPLKLLLGSPAERRRHRICNVHGGGLDLGLKPLVMSPYTQCMHQRRHSTDDTLVNECGHLRVIVRLCFMSRNESGKRLLYSVGVPFDS
jgi:hypothetical protein